MKFNSKNTNILFLALALNLLAFAASAQEITYRQFKFKSGKNTLYGQISLPTGKTKVPLIVFMPGSGASSYQSNYKEWLALTLEKAFIHDYAILNFDKPGMYKSTGEWYKEDYFKFAYNAICAVRYAKKNFPVDTTKVIIIGHSQGGWHAQVVASEYPKEIKCAISLVGPAVSVFEQEVETLNSKYLCEGADPVKAGERALTDTYKEYAYPVTAIDTNKDDLHFRIIKGYDPRMIIEKINIPFLFVYAEKDELVDPVKSQESITNLFDHHIPKNISVFVVPGADHRFKVHDKCFTGDRKALKISAALNLEMESWLNKVLN